MRPLRFFSVGCLAAALLLDPLGAEETARPALEDLPEVAREYLGPGVWEEIEGHRRLLDSALANTTTSAASLASAYGELAKVFHAYKLHTAAGAGYRNAERLEPDSHRWPYFLALLAFDDGDPAEAAERLSRVLELDPANQPARLRLGEALLQLGRWEEAEAAFGQALEDEAGSAAAHYGLGRAADARQEHSTAVEHFERALELQPGANLVHYSLALAYRHLGDLDKAQHHSALYGRVGVVFPEPLSSELRETAQSTHFFTVFADLALDIGKFDAAEKGFRRALEADADNPKAHRGLGLVAQSRGDLATAREHFLEAHRLDPESADYPYYLAEIASRSGDLETAIEYLGAALDADPGLHYARFRLAEAHRLQGRHDEALRLYEEVLASEAQNRPALLNRVGMLHQLGRLGEARRRAEELVEQAPGDAAARVALASILKDLGESAAAEHELETALGLEAPSTDTALAHYNLGVMLDERKIGLEAAKHYAMAIDLDPDLLEARFQLGVSLARANRMGDAAQLFTEVLERRPGHLEARLGLATAEVLRQRYAAARTVLEEGVRVAPDNVTLVHTLALLLATCPEDEVRDGARAAELALRAFQAQPTLEHAETLAISYAEAGDFDAAVSWQTRLVEEVASSENAALATRLQTNLERYRKGLPAISPWAVSGG